MIWCDWREGAKMSGGEGKYIYPIVLMVLRGAGAIALLLSGEEKANILRGTLKMGYNALILKAEFW